MILPDTDHVSVLQVPGSQRRTSLVARMTLAADQSFGVSIVSVEEQMRGWLSTIAKERQIDRQVKPYHELGRLFEFFQAFVIKPFDHTAAAKFAELRASKVRVASMDFKRLPSVDRQQARLREGSWPSVRELAGMMKRRSAFQKGQPDCAEADGLSGYTRPRAFPARHAGPGCAAKSESGGSPASGHPRNDRQRAESLAAPLSPETGQ